MQIELTSKQVKKKDYKASLVYLFTRLLVNFSDNAF